MIRTYSAWLMALTASTQFAAAQLISADGRVRTFKGIPYAAPPVGPLRWKPPQPAPSWTGVRKAAEYGPRCMQGPIYPDMIFHDAGPSADCLYLNLWMPAAPSVPATAPSTAQARLPGTFRRRACWW